MFVNANKDEQNNKQIKHTAFHPVQTVSFKSTDTNSFAPRPPLNKSVTSTALTL